MSETIGIAKADPTKTFFVKMITRDITLEDCIMDLIDNSVDGAWRLKGHRPMGLEDDVDLSDYSVDILLTPDRFSILDDCGGMKRDEAEDHAFSFGRLGDDVHDDYSIGVYGIGMKRAVFKLGRSIRVRSTYTEDGTTTSFAVPIDVDAWLGNEVPPWKFDIVHDKPLPKDGVEVSVESLTRGAAQAFSNPAFVQNLRRMIGRDYTLHLSRGLKISLNKVAISGWPIELRQSEDIAPVRLQYEDTVGDETVNVEIIAGMAGPPPDSLEPDEASEGDRRSGWYVVCNGRIVLAADRTSISVWAAEDWPQWHSQYAGFIGVILFAAANATALPLTTTKRSVDTASELYRRARLRMRDVTKQWIAYTNARRQDIDRARAIENAASSVSLRLIGNRDVVRLPTFTPRPPSEPAAFINYTVSKARLRKMAMALDGVNMTQRDVGLKTFDYCFEDLVGKD